MRPDVPYAAELAAAIEAAILAGAAVRDLYDRAAAARYEKRDGSVVTDADLAADRIVRRTLGRRFPNDPLLTEEGIDDPVRLASERCWIVDPIDGTDQFVRRTGEFDVLIALVDRHRPVVAVGYQPPARLLCAATRGGGAWLRQGDEGPFAPVRLAPLADGATPVVASTIWFGAPGNRPAIAAIAARLGGTALPGLETGFSPRTFLDPRRCDAMVGVRPGRAADQQAMAWEWDFAAPDLFVHEAGGVVTDLAGRPFRYNKPVPRNEGGLVAAVDPAVHARVLAAVRQELAIG